MKATRWTLSILMSIILVVGLMPLPAFAEGGLTAASVSSVSSARVQTQSLLTTQGTGTQTSKTVDEAIAWAKSKVGSKVDSGQCVAFVKAYYKYLGMDTSKVWGNGKDYATNYCFGWSRVKGGTPQRGDILVYSSSSNGYGHVAICDSATSIYEQNYNNCLKVQHHTWKYNSGYEPGYWGYIRPNWKPSAPKPITIANGVYTMRMASAPSMAVDVEGQSKADRANVHMWTIHNKPSQQWKFTKQSNGSYVIQNVNSGKVLDVQGASKSSGANVHQWPSHGGANQQWCIYDMGNGAVALKSVCSGMYLDIRGYNTANGTNVWQYAYTGSAAQRFKLVSYGEFGTRTDSISDGYYVLQCAANDAYAVDRYCNETKNGTNVQIYHAAQNEAQVFRIAKQSDGYYKISAKNSDSAVLDVSGGSLQDSANVQLYASNNSYAQRWIARSCGNGVYAFQNVQSGKFLDVKGAKFAAEVNVQQYIGNNSNAQKFRLVPWSKALSSGRVTIGGVSSNYNLTGKAVNPAPTLKWLASSFNTARVPESGTAGGSYWSRRIFKAQAGKTYIVEIGKVARLAGSAANAQIRAVNPSNGLDVAPRAAVKWGDAKQVFSITPTQDCGIYIYPAVAENTKGCAAQFSGVRVYEKLANGTDYSVSYLDASKRGIAASQVKGDGVYYVQATGKNGYSGSVTRAFSLGKKLNELAVAPVKATQAAKYGKKTTIASKKVFKITKNLSRGKVSYAKTQGNAKIKVSGSGKVTVAKGLARGAYVLKVKVTSKATTAYQAASRVVTFKVKVG